MLTRKRIATISKLAFPVGIALSSNMAMSLIDLAMVGTLGDNAIAAVGLSVFCNSLILSFVTGIVPAVQGLVARRRGANSEEPKALPLNGGLLIALLVGTPLTIVCYIFAPLFFSLISSDPAVTKLGTPFLGTLCAGIVGTGMLSAFEGHWYGMEKPKVFMIIILLMDGLNIVLNYALIWGHFGAPARGARGAAIAWVVSLYTGVIANLVMTYYRCRNEDFLIAKPKRALLWQIVELGLPATVQGFFYTAGYVVYFWLVGQIGTRELAAANVLARISMGLLLLSISLGNASASLVSRTVGEGNIADAAAWGWDAGKLGVIGITLLGLPLFLFPKVFLSIFISDPYTISIAVIPLRLVAATTGLCSLIYIFAYTLISLGDGNRVALVSFVTQWILFLPGVWILGPHLHYGLLQLSFLQAGYGCIATLLIVAIWAEGKWKRIRI
jgi:multidrug resistance protein, MATE family